MAIFFVRLIQLLLLEPIVVQQWYPTRIVGPTVLNTAQQWGLRLHYSKKT
jgi:hypothetical protein